MQTLRIESTRGETVENVHEVDVVVTGPGGRVVAQAGDPTRPVFWRSAIKPFQALPLVEDGVADALGLDPEALALACASHSAEPRHRELALAMLARAGATEADLACGPHPSLSAEVHAETLRSGVTMTPVWSNCSGKHAGFLALARHHDWPFPGYEAAGHPVQQRVLMAVRTVALVDGREPHLGVDGCTAVSVAAPLVALARAWGRLGSEGGPLGRLREAMLAHPFLIAGTRRFDTDLVEASGGRVLAKIGADGVYGATIPALGLGLGLKVRSGDMRAAAVAVAGMLSRLLAPALDATDPLRAWLAEGAAPVLRNTRGAPTGGMRLAGTLQEFD